VDGAETRETDAEFRRENDFIREQTSCLPGAEMDSDLTHGPGQKAN
jgi:hypothetical protein